MALIGLLLAALVCIVLGVVYASGPWFIGSIVASLLAAYLLWRQRQELAGHTRKTEASQAATPAARQTTLVTATAFAGAAAGESARNEPRPGGEGGPAGTQETPAPASTVWVVDGLPEYHNETCGHLDGLAAEAVPYAQAAEDGFVRCRDCHPDAAPAEALAQPTTEPATTPGAPRDVWVVDGRPRFHLERCMIIKDQAAEPIPIGQATEDGFMPCTLCEPTASRAS